MNALSPRSRIPVQAIHAVLIAVGLLVVSSSCQQAELDHNLCPKGEPPRRQTVLLLDTSDPLTPKHRAELERLVRELQQPKSTGDDGSFYVAPGEALIVYEMAADWQNLKPVVHVCNPGDRPEDWNWKKSLTQGKIFALHNWRQFEERIKALYPDRNANPASASPVLETLTVIVPRHAPSKRSGPAEGRRPVHVILFSDLLQHSELLSHYGRYPEATKFLATPGLTELRTDLTRVRVTLFRLERSQYARWQTKDHYYWWTHLVREFNGKVQWQEPL